MNLTTTQLFEIQNHKFDQWLHTAGLDGPETARVIHSCYNFCQRMLRSLEKTEFYPNELSPNGKVFIGLFIIFLADNAGCDANVLIKQAHKCGLRIEDLVRLDAAIYLLSKQNGKNRN